MRWDFSNAFTNERFAIRESRIANEAMALKPQDVYVALKLVAAGPRRVPYSHLAIELVMSPSEVHASVNTRVRVVCFTDLVWRIVQTWRRWKNSLLMG
jgi:hypothetical protein